MDQCTFRMINWPYWSYSISLHLGPKIHLGNNFMVGRSGGESSILRCIIIRSIIALSCGGGDVWECSRKMFTKHFLVELFTPICSRLVFNLPLLDNRWLMVIRRPWKNKRLKKALQDECVFKVALFLYLLRSVLGIPQARIVPSRYECSHFQGK